MEEMVNDYKKNPDSYKKKPDAQSGATEGNA